MKRPKKAPKKKAAVKAAPVGRPTDYDVSFCEKAIALGKDGASKTEIAVDIGCGRSTFYRWIEEHPEFRDAIKEAEAQAQAWWERKGRTAIFASTGFNATAYIFNMKNRFSDDYKDRAVHEHSGPNGGPIETKSDIELARIIAFALAKGARAAEAGE